MNTTPSSSIRRQSRTLVARVINDHVLKPLNVAELTGEDLLELRAALRAAYPFAERKGWRYKVWGQEVRAALGFQVRKPARKYKIKPRSASAVMPSMRQWAIERGLATVDTPEPAETAGPVYNDEDIEAMEEWEEGRQARDMHTLRTSNPYPLGAHEQQAWDAGWTFWDSQPETPRMKS